MQTIQTKYLGPTDHRKSRVKAKCAGATAIVEWDHSLNTEDNHLLAAYYLAVNKLKWDSWLKMENIVTGSLSDGSMVHVVRGAQ